MAAKYIYLLVRTLQLLTGNVKHLVFLAQARKKGSFWQKGLQLLHSTDQLCMPAMQGPNFDWWMKMGGASIHANNISINDGYNNTNFC